MQFHKIGSPIEMITLYDSIDLKFSYGAQQNIKAFDMSNEMMKTIFQTLVEQSRFSCIMRWTQYNWDDIIDGTISGKIMKF